MFETHVIYVDREGDGSGQLSDILVTTGSDRFYQIFSERYAIHSIHKNSAGKTF